MSNEVLAISPGNGDGMQAQKGCCNTGRVDKREEAEGSAVEWHVAEKRGKVKALPEGKYKDATEWPEYKASMRSKVEHPFRVAKRQFGYALVRSMGLAKNTTQPMTLFALSNLWMAL